jgi:hypothetical protein
MNIHFCYDLSFTLYSMLAQASMLKLGIIQMANDNLDTAYMTFTQVLRTRQKLIGTRQPEVSLSLVLLHQCFKYALLFSTAIP